MDLSANDRRAIGRVRLLKPLNGTIGTSKVFISDMSLKGFRVVHQEPLGKPGTSCQLKFDCEGMPLRADCQVAWSQPQPAPKTSTAKPLFHSGLQLTKASDTVLDVLREFIAVHVLRAIDEQKANARGIPAIAAQSFQTGHSKEFKKHEFMAGRWRETVTTDPVQPMNGFTISSETTPGEVRTLRDAYEAGDVSARHMIRQMAGMSISSEHGIPTRRYEP